MASNVLDPLDDLIPIRRLLVDGKTQRNALNLNFSGIPTELDEDTFTLTVSLANATGFEDGLMSAEDKARFDLMQPEDSNPNAVGTANPGVRPTYSRGDHVHAHGDQLGGSLHALATDEIAGFMSPDQYTELGNAADGLNVSQVEDGSGLDALVVRDASGFIGVSSIRTPEVVRKSSGTLRVEGQAGVVIGHGANDIVTITHPSSDNGLLNFGQQRTVIQNDIGGSSQLVVKVTSASGAALFDTSSFGFRDNMGGADYVQFLNKTSGLPVPGDAQTAMGTVIPGITSSAADGRWIWYGKDLVWDENHLWDSSNVTTYASSKRKLHRLGRARSTTATVTTVLTIPAADLPSGNYRARMRIEWSAYDVTANKAAMGIVHALARRTSGTTTIVGQQSLIGDSALIIGAIDDGVAIIDDPVQVSQSSGDILITIESNGTNEVRSEVECYLVAIAN